MCIYLGRTTTLDDFDVNAVNRTAVASSSSKSVSKIMTPPFFVETKWDGERFQVHYDGSQLKYMSKQGHDFTRYLDITFSPRFRPQIQGCVRSFIIDGEMMAWNKKYKYFTQKGSDVDVKKLRLDNPNHCPCYVAFDVLFYNGEILIEKPLQQRFRILKTILKPIEGAVVVPEPQILETRQQVEAAFNNAIDNLEEGLVVKAIDSEYVPGKRILSWRKLKPEVIMRFY